jgi:hypothetical protein
VIAATEVLDAPWPGVTVTDDRSGIVVVLLNPFGPAETLLIMRADGGAAWCAVPAFWRCRVVGAERDTALATALADPTLDAVVDAVLDALPFAVAQALPVTPLWRALDTP